MKHRRRLCWGKALLRDWRFHCATAGRDSTLGRKCSQQQCSSNEIAADAECWRMDCVLLIQPDKVASFYLQTRTRCVRALQVETCHCWQPGKKYNLLTDISYVIQIRCIPHEEKMQRSSCWMCHFQKPILFVDRWSVVAWHKWSCLHFWKFWDWTGCLHVGSPWDSTGCDRGGLVI